MKYFVTGGSGFIGSALVHRLVNEGQEVTVLDNNSRGKASRLERIAEKIRFVEGDARLSEVVTRASKGCEVFLHLAAVNGTENFYEHPELVLDVGVRSMLAALDACRANGIPQLVLASSSEAYQSPSIVPTPEGVPLIVPDVMNPRYSYGGSKIISELLAINYGRRGFDRVMIFRPHNVYGPDMGWEHVLPQFIGRAVEEIAKTPLGLVPFSILGSGAQTRSFIHIDDFCDGVLTILAKGKHLEVYHIGTTEELTVRDLAERVVAFFGREAQVFSKGEATGETLRRCPDISKIRGLGFDPKITFNEGLPTIANWYAKNQSLAPVKDR